MKHTLDAAYLE